MSQGGILSAIEYQVHVEQAVDTLKADLPTLFEKDISYDIYTKDVYFQDPVNKFKGKINLIYQHIDTWDREPGEILNQFFRKGEAIR